MIFYDSLSLEFFLENKWIFAIQINFFSIYLFLIRIWINLIIRRQFYVKSH